MLRLLPQKKSFKRLPWPLYPSLHYYYGASDKKPKPAPLQERKMIDRFRMSVKGGDGGRGCSSVRRSRHDRRGTPDGGGGGRGGDVILKCCHSVWDFSGLQHHVNAQKGGNGTSKNRIGSRGDDKVVLVPVGTVVHVLDGAVPDGGDGGRCPTSLFSDESEDEVVEKQPGVMELTEVGHKLTAARGGSGGFGGVDGKGESGTEALLTLELKSIADVGLVGMPNAGKSTLLAAMSRARPVIGDYAFTTLRPNLGSIRYEDSFSATVADIPGLISGAHENRGLGHAFLRHIERTKVLIYVVDLIAGIDGGGPPPWGQLQDLISELEHYKEGLSGRPSLIAANKIDGDGAESVLAKLKCRVGGARVYPVCAVLGEGVSDLKDALRSLVAGDGFR